MGTLSGTHKPGPSTSELETAYDFIARGPGSSSSRRSTSLMRLGPPAAISVGR
jgi:hypothetical protein